MLEEVAERAERHGAPGIALDALAAAATCYRSAGQPRHAFRCQIAAEAARATRPNQRSSPYDRMQPVLSGREQEVAELASQGETNRQIAAELYLSPRTVERHLERIYRRLGIKSRVELAALFDGNSPDRPS